MLHRSTSLVRPVRRFCAVAMVALALSACKTNPIDFTASLAGRGEFSEDALKKQADDLGRAYDRKPGEKMISLRYAQALRQLGQHGQALAVLQRASIANVNDTDISPPNTNGARARPVSRPE